MAPCCIQMGAVKDDYFLQLSRAAELFLCFLTNPAIMYGYRLTNVFLLREKKLCLYEITPLYLAKNELYLLAKIRLWAVFISSNRLCKITFYSSIRNNCHHITIFK